MTPFDFAVSIALGVGLAAAVGFRVFLPLLITSVAAYGGYIPVSDGFAWQAGRMRMAKGARMTSTTA